jgi:hypothetical protein
MSGQGEMANALPGWMRTLWLYFAPFGLVFSFRIAWEKTVWTWSRGPQMVGFALMHIHPGLAIGGALCCYLLMLWLIPATIYLIVGRKRISRIDRAMVGVSLFVAAALIIPDTFFA